MFWFVFAAFWFVIRAVLTIGRVSRPRRSYAQGGSGVVGVFFGFAIVIGLLLTIGVATSGDGVGGILALVFLLLLFGIRGRARSEAPPSGFHGEPGHNCPNCPDPNRPIGPQTLSASKPPPDDAMDEVIPLLPLLPLLRKPRQRPDDPNRWRPYQQPLLPDDRD